MPQLDLETSDPLPEGDLDPPESFRLSKDAELELYGRNAFYYERKESTKLANSNANSNSNSNSQRFSNFKSKPSIIALPKTQKAAYAEAKTRRPNNKPENTRLLFPKRSGKLESCLVEPSSPNVSCMGRVRSRRDRNRRLRHRQRSKRSTVSEAKVVIKEQKKNRFFESFRAVFSPRVRKPPPKGPNSDDDDDSPPVRVTRGDIRDRLPAGDRGDGVEPAGTGE